MVAALSWTLCERLVSLDANSSRMLGMDKTNVIVANNARVKVAVLKQPLGQVGRGPLNCQC